MSFKQFSKELFGSRVEGEIVKTAVYSVITSIVFLGLLYFFKFKTITDFMPKYGFFLVFAALSYALIIPTLKQVRAYREMGCMAGMMVGMTIGMIAGFLSGFYIGATNGMFVGSVFGLIVGITMGVYNGKCCGIMGVMEGTMAGFMGGLMGPMTAVMMLNDNLKAISVIVFIVSAIIMFGLNYMIYKEMREMNTVKSDDNFSTIMVTFVLIALTTWIIVNGPRSALFG
ncbi:MAG: hypothetical protein AABW73_02210 [Nanoarchaeota archaeon]